MPRAGVKAGQRVVFKPREDDGHYYRCDAPEPHVGTVHKVEKKEIWVRPDQIWLSGYPGAPVLDLHPVGFVCCKKEDVRLHEGGA